MSTDHEKFVVAQYIIDNLPPVDVIGLGSGTTVNIIIELLAKRTNPPHVVSASSGTSLELEKYGIPEVPIHSMKNQLPICIDGADQVVISSPLQVLKGHGGALTREKILWMSSSKIMIAIDSSKLSNFINKSIPIEIVPFSKSLLKKELANLNLQWSKITLRRHPQSKMPIVTDNNNYIMDLLPAEPLDNLPSLHHTLKQFFGVVETGLFCGKEVMNASVLVGQGDSVTSY
ncbi:MAG: ribose 5-phosphate isomerase A [Candidatus Kariarchaeaceae archaeon]|jgi:ribose 5-phosphate isomerase A